MSKAGMKSLLELTAKQVLLYSKIDKAARVRVQNLRRDKILYLFSPLPCGYKSQILRGEFVYAAAGRSSPRRCVPRARAPRVVGASPGKWTRRDGRRCAGDPAAGAGEGGHGLAQEAPSGRRHAAAGREDHARNRCVIPVKTSSQGATTRGRVHGRAWSRAFPRCLQAEEPCAWSKSGVTTAWSRALPQGRCCCFPTAACVKKRETIAAWTDPENAKKEFACRPKIKIARAVRDRPN